MARRKLLVADRSPEADRMLALAHDLIHAVE
jgi:hypothetical protein